MIPKISVVIPVYNEEVNIKKGVLNEIGDYMDSLEVPYEVILVDDKSEDTSLELLKKFAKRKKEFKVIEDIHNGKAFTLMRGAKEAKGQIVLLMDTDQATPVSELEKLLPYFLDGYDIVIGSRGGRRENAPLGRMILSTGQVVLRNILLGFRDITDTQCGFKAYKREVLNKILDNLHIFSYENAHEIDFPSVSAGFDVEILFLATKMGYKIKEVPVKWDYKMSRRVNLVKDALRGVTELLTLRALSIQGKYKVNK